MSTEESIRAAIVEKIPDAEVAVTPGSGGHYAIDVVSPVFAGKSTLDKQRLVYGAIAHLMKGDGAPVHAVDKLTTREP
jgi:acid stress-induced BolA-like protein IbaG/YrbA